jgi:hypothetical protein
VVREADGSISAGGALAGVTGSLASGSSGGESPASSSGGGGGGGGVPTSSSGGSSPKAGAGAGSKQSLPPPKAPLLFSLSVEDDCKTSLQDVQNYKLLVNRRTNLFPPNPTMTSTLNPARPPEILTSEIFDLLCTQMKYIVGLAHKPLIQKTMKGIVDLAKQAVPESAVDFGEILWGNPRRLSTYEGSITAVSRRLQQQQSEENERRRGRSPGRALGSTAESRKHSQSLPKGRNSIAVHAAAAASGSKDGIAVTASSSSAKNSGSSGLATTGEHDSDHEGASSAVAAASSSSRPPVGAERRSRSSSTGARLNSSTGGAASKSPALSLKKLSSMSGDDGDDDDSVDTGSGTGGAGGGGGPLLNGVPVSAFAAKQIAVLQSLSPDMQLKLMQTKGPIYSTWMVTHPLQVRSVPNTDLLQVVADSSIIAAKKLEWELDIMREYDEKRMEQYERFLISRRSKPAGDNSSTGAGSGPATAAGGQRRGRGGRGGKAGVEYYKDKGRQAFNR